jgi:hypothetical protein
MLSATNANARATPTAMAMAMACLNVEMPMSASGSESSALSAVLPALGALMDHVPLIDGERQAALLVVAQDAANTTAVQFWRDALATGPAMASPSAFAWCLANAPCAAIAREFVMTGANVTWLVTDLGAKSAFDAPAAFLAELASESVDESTSVQAASHSHAVVVALRFSPPHARLLAWHIHLHLGLDTHQVQAQFNEDWANSN